LKREVLHIENLKVYYYTLTGVVRAVDDVSLKAREGEMLAIVGESGSGKSTLGLSILGMVLPPGKIVSGRIVIDDIDITKLKKEELRRVRGKLVSIVFQDPFTTLDPVRKVGDQIVEIMVEHGVSETEAKRRARELMEAVGLPRDAVDRYPHQLSGGQRQRVSIAEAIALEPKVLVADEPTTALDVIVQKQIMDLLDRLKRDRGITIVFITHDIALAAERSDYIAIMYGGQIMEYGPTREVVEKPMHPYTKALLESVPEIGVKRWPKPIPGTPPDLRRPPEGCRFRPRCPFADERCLKEPPLEKFNDRYVKCWKPLGVKVG
jgi:peptide/nickel transport system ATP-binding protein